MALRAVAEDREAAFCKGSTSGAAMLCGLRDRLRARGLAGGLIAPTTVLTPVSVRTT